VRAFQFIVKLQMIDHHIEALARMLKELESEDIGLYEHHYWPMAFGNFTVVLGRAHKRVKFDWDSRESVLAVSLSDFSNQGDPPEWVHDMDVSVPKSEGLYAEIASNVTDMLSI
jgi:hypothetical protein